MVSPSTGQFTADKRKDGAGAGGNTGSGATVQASCLQFSRPYFSVAGSLTAEEWVAKDATCGGQVDILHWSSGSVIGFGNVTIDRFRNDSDTATVFWTWTTSAWNTQDLTYNAGGYLGVAVICTDSKGIDRMSSPQAYPDASKPGTYSGYTTCPYVYDTNQTVKMVMAGSEYNPTDNLKRYGVIWKKN